MHMHASILPLSLLALAPPPLPKIMQPLPNQINLIPHHAPPPSHNLQTLPTRPDHTDRQPEARECESPDQFPRLVVFSEEYRVIKREGNGRRDDDGDGEEGECGEEEDACCDAGVWIKVAVADDGCEGAGRAGRAVLEGEARDEAGVEEAERPVLDEVDDMRLFGAEVRVEGDEAVKFDEDGEEEGDEEDEAAPYVCEAQCAEGDAANGCSERGECAGGGAVDTGDEFVSLVDGVGEGAEGVEA